MRPGRPESVPNTRIAFLDRRRRRFARRFSWYVVISFVKNVSGKPFSENFGGIGRKTPGCEERLAFSRGSKTKGVLGRVTANS
jgi:hypothetical protein